MDYSRGRALIIQQTRGLSISSSSCFSFGASNKNCDSLWLKQQNRMKENCVLLFGETDGMALFLYVY